MDPGQRLSCGEGWSESRIEVVTGVAVFGSRKKIKRGAAGTDPLGESIANYLLAMEKMKSNIS